MQSYMSPSSRIRHLPPVGDLSVDRLPNPPPRAPRLDVADAPPGAHDPRGIYDPYALQTGRLRGPWLRYNLGSRWSRRSFIDRPVEDLTSYEPGHIILTLESSDVLRLGNVPLATTQYTLRTMMPPLWPQGMSRDVQKDTEWIMKFRGRPWTVTGPESIMTGRLLCRVFKCLADQGWSYLAAVHSGEPPVRHVFQTSPPDLDSHFFAMMLSGNKEELTFVDCSQDLARAISRQVRNLYAPNVVREGWRNLEGYTLQIIRRDFMRRHEDVALLIAQILKGTAERGYKLDASIPLSKSAFGLGKRREVWIFRKITGFIP
ncbi:hypothetical protein SISSUDRAFT_545984 [Sistotremastrum suecicum HHB10207 ss-3]|uniref:Uncharacterized protein n=1 Tax=Sistotremastrum suecicum HHB10207 ss-3 TaxID=1314776 RepID=A0A166EY59_9AGAM|nr:hypothetical protein SISSUDRAFT_545984 [Sistotremastrum suecicum HHB10207 ss-3]